MIKDPEYWRRDLLDRARRLESRRTQLRWTHVSFTRTEQEVMLGFSSVRKIIEAGKMSRGVRGIQVRLLRFGRGPWAIPDSSGPLLMVYYDLNKPEHCHEPLAFVCNQIVHSYIFGVAVGYEGGLQGVYFASDREWRAKLYFASAAEIVRILRQVGEDPDAEFSPWAEVNLDQHRVQVAFPPNPRKASNHGLHPSAGAKRSRSGHV